jgi:nucleoside-diphosphate-sugar epimerase
LTDSTSALLQEAARIEGENILVTGGAGFIGSTFVSHVIERNRVTILDTMQRDALRYWPGLADHKNLRLLKGSILDPDAVRSAMHRATMVVHCAAVAGVDTVIKNPTRTLRVNIIGTWRLLEEAAGRNEIKRFVDFSTSEIFGSYAYKVREGDVATLGAVGEARWTYAVSKLATEHMAHTWQREFGLPTVVIRPFNIYGPRQVGEGAIHHFIRRAVAGEPLTIHNDGSQIRSWCYVDDIIEALCRVLTNDAAVGHSFNIGNARSTITIYNLAREIVRLAHSSSEISFVEWNAADVELRIPNVDKSREVLDFASKIDLEEGLLRTIAWYRDQGSA